MALFRIVAATATDPLFFGPKPGDPPAGRFDAADGNFATCYAGLTPEACFAEKFLRRLPGRAIEAALVRLPPPGSSTSSPKREPSLPGSGR